MIRSHHLHLQWKFHFVAGKLLEVMRQNFAGWCQQTFYLPRFVDNAQQCFAFTSLVNVPPYTVRPRDTRPWAARTSQVHVFELGPKFEMNEFMNLCPALFCHLHLKQTFPPIIWIYTEGEGDRIKSKLPFKTFSTLHFKQIQPKYLI